MLLNVRFVPLIVGILPYNVRYISGYTQPFCFFPINRISILKLANVNVEYQTKLGINVIVLKMVRQNIGLKKLVIAVAM